MLLWKSCSGCHKHANPVGQEELLQALIDEKHAKDEPDEVT